MSVETDFHQNRIQLFEKAGLDPHARWPKGTMGWRHTLASRFSITSHQVYLLLHAVDLDVSWDNLQERKEDVRARKRSRIVSQGNRTRAKMRRKLQRRTRKSKVWTMQFARTQGD